MPRCSSFDKVTGKVHASQSGPNVYPAAFSSKQLLLFACIRSTALSRYNL